MAIELNKDPDPPTARTSGHFAHHNWLFDSVKKIAEVAVPTPEPKPEIDTTQDSDVVLSQIVDVLVSMGVVTKKGTK